MSLRPPLFENGQFAAHLFGDPSGARLLELHFAPEEPPPPGAALPDLRAEADAEVVAGHYEAALYFPPDFARRLEAFREAVRRQTWDHGAGQARNEATVRLEVPSPEIIHSTANEKSDLAFARLAGVLQRWSEQIGEDNLIESGMPKIAARPFLVGNADVADAKHRGASFWARILPVLLLLWALTGAFYPAIDLCAGEKERGTLETLLCSPAARSEIVVGKLLTIMLFSMITVVLNLLSMGITGWLVLTQMPGLGLPPPAAIAALAVALVPMSALFSALCLGLAAFARSTKEGQYYLMPLLCVTMPLVVLPMSPGVELNLGQQPDSRDRRGAPAAERAGGQLLAGGPVLAGRGRGHALSLPAVDPLGRRAVQFRSRCCSARASGWTLGFGCGGCWRDRQTDADRGRRRLLRHADPGGHISSSASRWRMPGGFGGFVRTVLVTQLAVIAAPALLMTLLLDRQPAADAVAQAAALVGRARRRPVGRRLASGGQRPADRLVRQLYPMSENVRPASGKNAGDVSPGRIFGTLVLVIAIVPAVCEELAFRGFILSGFRHFGHKWRAIIFSACCSA